MDELSRRPVVGDSTAWNTVDDQTVETPHTLHVVRAMRGILRHPVSEFLMWIPMGRSEDIRLALRRREQREMKNKKSNVANLLEAQRVRGKAIPRGNRGTPWKKTPNDCDHPPTAIQKGGNAALYYERCEMCGNRWQRIPLTVVARYPETTLAEQSHSACVHRVATGRDRTHLLSTRTREHDDAGHAAAEPLHGRLDVQYNLRTQPGRVRCSTCGLGELRGCRREHGSYWGRRDTAPLKVQRQLNGVDQEACLQLIPGTGQRPESQITTLRLVPRQKVESGEQVTDSFNIPEGFFNCDGARIPTDEVGSSPGASGH